MNIFVVGIKGAAMSNIAVILKKMGRPVTGSDIEESFITDSVLQEHNIQVIHSFDADKLPQNTDLVIYSAAHGGYNNPQVKEALRRGIRVQHQVELLNDIMKGFDISVAVCGCHGKTTTSAMLAYSLKQLGAKPSYLVGTSAFNNCHGGDLDGRKIFVVEADEYAMDPPDNKIPKFFRLHPRYSICTNIDFDHPDVFENVAATKEAFSHYFRNIVEESKSNKLFLCADDLHLMVVAQRFPRESYITYGTDISSDLLITEPAVYDDYSQFNLTYKKKNLGSFSISLFGEKNILNATGVILALLHLGFGPEEIKKITRSFTGAKRRFEKVAYENNIYLFDDYAHHPEEIQATISAAKSRFKDKRIIVIFQPHTFSRTLALKDHFIKTLSAADYVFLSPIFGSAREAGTPSAISSADLQKQAEQNGKNTFFAYETVEALTDRLKKVLQPGDVIFTMGAGDVYKLKNDIIEVVKSLKL